MLKQILKTIDEHFPLGKISRTQKLAHGLVNTVWHIETDSGQFVVKIINHNSARARQKADYIAIERLCEQLHDKGVSLVKAIEINGEPLFEHEGTWVMLFPYLDGKVLSGPLGPIDTAHAKQAGQLIGNLHNAHVEPQTPLSSVSFEVTVNQWCDLMTDANRQSAAWLNNFTPHADKHIAWLSTYEQAFKAIQQRQIVTHCDFMAHNVIACHGKLSLIDWELAGLYNPETELALALISCSGAATKNFNPEIVTNMLNAYLETGASIEIDPYHALWAAVGKAWFNWIAFNLKRTLDTSLSQTERDACTNNALDALSGLDTIVSRIPALIEQISNTTSRTSRQ
jgi:Ser/Thr protein kinase RdoA (MazF antagonist)